MDTESVITDGVRVNGAIHGAGALAVAGQVDGKLTIDGHVTVNEAGQVNASIDSTDAVTVHGTVHGDITAERKVALTAQASVHGTITANTITVDPKATLKGQLRMPLDLPRSLQTKKRRSNRW